MAFGNHISGQTGTNMGGGSSNPHQSPVAEAGPTPTRQRTPAEIYADIAQQQHDDYITRGQFFEDYVIDSVLDPEKRAEFRGNAMGNTDEAVNQSFGRATSSSATLRSRFNQGQSANAKAITDRQNALAKGATLATARNATRNALDARENELLSGVDNTSGT